MHCRWLRILTVFAIAACGDDPSAHAGAATADAGEADVILVGQTQTDVGAQLDAATTDVPGDSHVADVAKALDALDAFDPADATDTSDSASTIDATSDAATAPDAQPLDAQPQDAQPADAQPQADVSGQADGASVDAAAGTPCPGSTAHLWDSALAHLAGDPVRVAAMGEGGMVVASTLQAVVELWRLTQNGSTAWTTTLKGATGRRANAIAAIGGGDVVIAGRGGTTATAKGWLVRVDAKGAVVWEKVVQYADTFNGATVLSDGPLVDVTVVGGAPIAVAHHPRPGVPSKTQSTLTWFDAAGKISAQDGMYLGGSTRMEAVAPWEAAGVVAAGTCFANSTDGDVCAVTWPKPGEVGGTHGIVQVFPSPGVDRVTGVVSFVGGRVAVAGVKLKGTVSSLLLMMLDGTGKQVTSIEKAWVKAQTSAAHALWLSGAGGLIIAAETSSGATLGGPQSQSWLFGTTEFGDVIWQRSLDVTGVADRLADVAGLADDKLAAVGVVGGNLRALRTTPWGHPTCDKAAKCALQTIKSCAGTNACTASVCEAAVGCVNAVVADGTPCPVGSCKAGVCKP